MTLLEVCCYSMACAQEAQRCGADRIELCAAPHEGGLTPSLGVLKTVRATVTIPVHPIIRPRGGDFCYTESEFAAMLDDVVTVRELGFPGVVIGVLDADGRVDITRMQKIMAAAGSLAVTFHRAFDMCADPYQAYRTLADSGVARILTSGQQASAEKGLSLITELIALGGYSNHYGWCRCSSGQPGEVSSGWRKRSPQLSRTLGAIANALPSFRIVDVRRCRRR